LKKVLIVDNDLSFAFWLGRALDQAGYDAFPARNVVNAIRLLKELKIVPDLMIITGACLGESSFLSELRQTQSGLTIIAVLDDPGLERGTFPRADLVEYKPAQIEEGALREWVGTVETVFAAREISRWQRTSTRQ